MPLILQVILPVLGGDGGVGGGGGGRIQEIREWEVCRVGMHDCIPGVVCELKKTEKDIFFAVRKSTKVGATNEKEGGGGELWVSGILRVV